MNQAAPEGWYEDPSDPARLRWWDGEEWTEFAGNGPLVELEDVAHAEVAPADDRPRGLWELEAESAARADHHPTTGSLSLAAAIAAVTSGDLRLPGPVAAASGADSEDDAHGELLNARVVEDAPSMVEPREATPRESEPDSEAEYEREAEPQPAPENEPEYDAELDVQPEAESAPEDELPLAAFIAHVDPAPALAPAAAPAIPLPPISPFGTSPVAAPIPIIRTQVRQLAPSDLLNARRATDTGAIHQYYAETVRTPRRASAWMIVIPIVWLLLSAPAIFAGWGVFAAALGLLPLLTGAYVAATGRSSWLRLASRQTGALVLAASLVLVVGGTLINKVVHPVLVVDTGVLGFAAPAIPEVTWAGPSADESGATDARQPIVSTPAPAETASPETTPAAEVAPVPVIETPAPLVEPSVAPEPAPVVEAPVAAVPSEEAAAPRADIVPVPAPSYANCSAVWQAGAAPIKRNDPGFQQKFDRDGDGTGCEKRPS